MLEFRRLRGHWDPAPSLKARVPRQSGPVFDTPDKLEEVPFRTKRSRVPRERERKALEVRLRGLPSARSFSITRKIPRVVRNVKIKACACKGTTEGFFLSFFLSSSSPLTHHPPLPPSSLSPSPRPIPSHYPILFFL